jgi:hypothetical protein
MISLSVGFLPTGYGFRKTTENEFDAELSYPFTPLLIWPLQHIYFGILPSVRRQQEWSGNCAFRRQEVLVEIGSVGSATMGWFLPSFGVNLSSSPSLALTTDLHYFESILAGVKPRGQISK